MKGKINTKVVLIALFFALVITASTYLIAPHGTKFYESISGSHNETEHGYPLSYLKVNNYTTGSVLNFTPSTEYHIFWPSLLVDIFVYLGLSLSVTWAYLRIYNLKQP